MDIREIALRVAKKMRAESEWDVLDLVCNSENFAEALVAEIAKQNVPCAFLHEWIEYHPFGDTFAGEPCATITNDEKPFDSSDTVSPLFTFPPSVEAIENKVAEACALQVATETKFHWLDAARVAKEIRSGEWRKFVKEG